MGQRQASQGDTSELQEVPHYLQVIPLRHKLPASLQADTVPTPHLEGDTVTLISIQKQWQTKRFYCQFHPIPQDGNGGIRYKEVTTAGSLLLLTKADSWSGQTMLRYMGLTFHFISGDLMESQHIQTQFSSSVTQVRVA